MRRIALITTYDEPAYGTRSLAAYLKEIGHDVRMIFFKRFRIHEVPRDNDEIRRWVREQGFLPTYEVNPFYDVACPFPYVPSETEWELLYKEIDEFGPDVLGFSLTSCNLPLTRKLSTRLRRRYPQLKQVWGGIHPTMEPVSSLEFADVVCVGEGEEAMEEWLKDPNRTDIPNLQFKDKDGSLIRNPVRELMRDLDDVPFALFADPDCEVVIEDDHVERPVDFGPNGCHYELVISSQRGCPYTCTYCLHGKTKKMYKGQKYLRRRSVGKFIDEVELRVKQFQLEAVFFWDDIFMMGSEWIEEFCDQWPKRVGLPFGGYAYTRCTTTEMLKKLREAGAYYVMIGMQSGSDRLHSQVYGRNTTQDKYLELGQRLVEADMHHNIIYELMTNSPYEKEEDCRATIELLSKMPKGVRLNPRHLTLYPTTILAETNKPRYNLDKRIFHFYNMLYLLAVEPGYDHRQLTTFADNPHLREHPEILESMLQQLWKAREDKELAERQAKSLERQMTEVQTKMPWGVKRATRHLASQVRSKLTRIGG